MVSHREAVARGFYLLWNEKDTFVLCRGICLFIGMNKNLLAELKIA